jgi:hypothetical protein
MKLFPSGLAFVCILILFSSSFIFGPPLLNESNYNKQYWVEFFIAAFSIPWIIYLWSRKASINFRFNLLDVVIVLLVLNYSIVAISQKSVSLIQSLPACYSLYYFTSKLVLSNLRKGEFDHYRQFFLMILPFIILAHISIIIIQMLGLSSSLNCYSNVGSTFGNPDMFGAYLVTLLPFCLIQKGSIRIFGYAVFMVSIITLILIQARSAILAIAICGFIWLILNKPMKLKVIILSSVLPVLLLILLIVWHPESVYGRIFIWFIATKMIIVKPFGWGLYAFDKYYPEFQASYLSTNTAVTNILSPEVVHSPFNEFLNIGVTIGIIGLALFIILAGLVFCYGIKSKDPLFYPVLAFLIISFSYFPFKISPMISLIIPVLALISIRSNKLIQIRLPEYSYKMILVLLLVMASFMAVKVTSGYTHYKKWQEAYSYSLDEDGLFKSVQLFSELYPSLKWDGRFLMTYSNLEYRQGDFVDALKLLEEAETYFCDITLSIKLAKLYEKLGSYEKAEQKFDLAINLAPNNMTAAYEKILFYKNIGEDHKAYKASVALINKPVRRSTFADPYILRSRLKKLILEYDQHIKE